MNAANPSSEQVKTSRIPGSNRARDADQRAEAQSHNADAADRPTQEQVTAALQRVRGVVWLMDNAVAIPGTPIKIGLDPVIGLFPGAGDLITSLIASYIVVEAKRLNMPKPIIRKMTGNVLIDFFAGLIPAVGDAVDVIIRANNRNLIILEAALRDMGYDV